MLEALYDPDPDAQGKGKHVCCGGFLHRAPEFDAGIFWHQPAGVRWQLIRSSGCCWRPLGEALERAGDSATASLHGSPTGVFVGVVYNDYGARVMRAPAGLEGYLGTGSAPSVASGRIAYTLGLQGPAIRHRHCVLVVAGRSASGVVSRFVGRECELALAGGVTVIPAASGFRPFSRQPRVVARRSGDARRFRRVRTAPAGAKGSGFWFWSVSPTPGATAIRCWPWCAVRRSIKTAGARG